MPQRSERTRARRPARDRSRSASPGGSTMHSMGWAQQSNYAQVRALAAGQAEIDRWHWETKDKAWFEGHFYSVKAPGLAAFTLPAYLALDAAGAKSVARDAAANASRADHPRWAPPDHPDLSQYAYSARAGPPGRGPGGEPGADRLGADPGGGGDPGGRAPAARPLGRGADRAGLRHRGGDHARAGDDRDDLRRRVLLSRGRRDARVRGLRAAVPRARGPGEDRPRRRRRPARRPGGQLRVPARPPGGDPVRLRRGPPGSRCAEPPPTPPGPRSEPRRRSPSTSGRSPRRFASPTRTRSPSRGSPGTRSWGSTRAASSVSTCRARVRRSTCCSPAAAC